jgi:cytoskeletal protein RodZ
MTRGFTERKVKTTQMLGEKLEEARKALSLSFDEISKRTTIQKKYLESLEAGRYNELPADVYVTGYLKSYVDCLSLDWGEIYALYKKERGIEEKVKNFTKKKSVAKIRTSPITITPKMIRLSAAGLVVLGVFFYLWYQVSGLSRPPTLALTEPAQDKTVKEDIIIISGQTEEGASLTINSQPIHIDSSGNFRESVGLQRGLNNLRIVSLNRFGRQTLVERKIMVESSSLAKSDSGTEESKVEADTKNSEGLKTAEGQNSAGELKFKVSIKEKATWVHVEEDGKVAYSGTMLPDSTQTFSAEERITLSSAKANTTYINFNGKDLGQLGETGEVVREMEFTKDLKIE